MKQVRWVWLPIVLVLLGACTTSTPQVEAEPDLMLAVVAGPLKEGTRLAFLPPLGGSKAKGVFDADVPLDVYIFASTEAGAAFGEPIGPTFSTRDGSIYIKNDSFRADWVVPSTAQFAGEYVRVEVRYAVGLEQDPIAPVCDSGAAGSCFGYFEARLFPNSGTDTSDTPDDVLVVVRERTVPITFAVRESGGEVPDTLGNLRKVNDNKPFTGDTEAPNCTEFDTPGQGLQAVGAGLQAVGAGFQAVGAGFQAVGAVGGLFRGEFAPSSLAYTDEVASEIRSILGATSSSDLVAQMVADSDGPVAILIVDDFGSSASPVYELPDNLFAADLVVTHGALVLEHVLALLDSALGYVPPELAGTGKNKPRGWVVSKVGAGSPTIAYSATYVPGKPSDSVPLVVVRAVNTHGADTDGIEDALVASIPVIVNGISYPQVVVNMSFAIVPCDTSADVNGSAEYVFDLNGDGVVSLHDYILALAEINDVKSSDSMELTSFVTAPPLEDDLLKYLAPCAPGQQICGGGTQLQSLVHVASSGNFAYPFPFFPAALGSVVSVGSQDALETGYTQVKSSFSNGSEVMTPGALFVADSRRVTEGGRTFTEYVSYAGTSFSAPNVSVFTALDLAKGEAARLCEPGTDPTGTESGLADLAVADGDVNDSENLPLGGAFGSNTAIDAYCGNER